MEQAKICCGCWYAEAPQRGKWQAPAYCTHPDRTPPSDLADLYDWDALCSEAPPAWCPLKSRYRLLRTLTAEDRLEIFEYAMQRSEEILRGRD